MKIFLTLIVLFFTSANLYAQKSNQPILGRWHSENNESTILLEERNGKIYGKIVALKDPYDEKGLPRTDLKNPKTESRNQPIIGLTVLRDLKPDGNNKWSGGRIYDPRSGHSYSCEMRLEGNVLKIRGYMGISFVGKTTNWRRAD
jgi:uncharacterized protein (DUF2147 family)